VTTTHASASARATDWNLHHPTGTPVLAWPGVRDAEPLRTRTRTSAWVLPSGQAVISVRGYAGGIHLDHIEHDPTMQPPVPDIEFECPPCPICGDAVDADGDGFTCLGCTWDDEAERCLAKHHSSRGHHTLDGLTSWDDTSSMAVTEGFGEVF
jgi:hypothetical protein